jgi:hypothetical protein
MSDMDTPDEIEIKQLDDLNLKILAEDIAAVLSKHVGGDFEVRVSNLDHSNVGGLDDQLAMRFVIKNKSWFVRHRFVSPFLAASESK